MGELTVEEVKRAVRPHLQVVRSSSNGHVPNLSPTDARKDLVLPRRAKSLLLARSASGQDRSARLFELGALLLEHGASPEAAFVLLQGSVWNKFSGRGDEAERIWEAVHRAEDSIALHQGPSSNGRERVKTGATRLDKLLAREIPPSEWCVERIWEHNGWGFIAGEPKTYKSTFATDLAVSLATGNDFLGHFPVVKPGPVLVVQEENTENIQWARFARILRHKGLSGKVHSFKDTVFEVTFPVAECPIYCIDRSRFSFTNKRKRKALEADIEAIQPRMVVLDPLQRMLGDLNIRSESDVTQVLDWLDYVNKTYRTSLLLVHHYHKRREEGAMEGGQRMLGSQALHAWLSCGLYVQRQQGGRLKVSREFRAFADGGPFEIEFQSEDDQDFYHVEVFESRPTKEMDKLKDIVGERPGITAQEAARALEEDPKRIRERARALGLQVKKRVNPNGGRPTLCFYPAMRHKTKGENDA